MISVTAGQHQLKKMCSSYAIFPKAEVIPLQYEQFVSKWNYILQAELRLFLLSNVINY